MTTFRELPVDGFAEALASDAPTPGGGSASALAGALAAGLVAMVARLTPGELDDVAAEGDALRAELLTLVDEDAAAFDAVMAAFRLPKETPEQQAGRSEAVQAAYRGAVEPPLRVCMRTVRVLELALRVAGNGNPNAVSDAGVAALLASAALEGAGLNVQINLGSIKDEAYRAAQEEHLAAARARGGALRDETLAAIQAKLA